MMVSCLAYLSTLQMEATCPSETLFINTVVSLHITQSDSFAFRSRGKFHRNMQSDLLKVYKLTRRNWREYRQQR
jgi:hypothetical protein